MSLLEIKNLTTSFATEQGKVQAVRGISLSVEQGEIVGIVGESGSGKSQSMYSVMGLLSENGTIESGSILFDGQEISPVQFDGNAAAYEKLMEGIRGNSMSMIFQDPMSFLNPVLTIGKQLTETITTHEKVTHKEAWDRAVQMLAKVGIPSPEARMKEFPHQLSGGMRQRVMIAMALSCNAALLIADEPTTALDVTIQAQILDLLRSINEKLGTSIILITHDLGVVASMVDTVAVMYCGHIVEKADVYTIFRHPLHPYTEGLLRSIPRMDDTQGELQTIEGSVPSIYDMPEGCAFHNRCAQCRAICQKQLPPVVQAEEGHLVQCWKYTDQWAQAQPARAGEGGSEHV